MRDYRNINHDDLLHDLYEQFCLSDFLTTMETAIDRYNNSIRSVIAKHAPAKLKSKQSQNFVLGQNCLCSNTLFKSEQSFFLLYFFKYLSHNQNFMRSFMHA